MMLRIKQTPLPYDEARRIDTFLHRMKLKPQAVHDRNKSLEILHERAMESIKAPDHPFYANGADSTDRRIDLELDRLVVQKIALGTVALLDTPGLPIYVPKTRPRLLDYADAAYQWGDPIDRVRDAMQEDHASLSKILYELAYSLPPETTVLRALSVVFPDEPVHPAACSILYRELPIMRMSKSAHPPVLGLS